MPTTDYIPAKEGDLVPWTENFILVANANLTTLDLDAADITALTTKKSTFSTNLNTAKSKQAESKAATENKNISKTSLVTNIRTLARQIQANPAVPSNLKEQLGLKSQDPTPSPINPVSPTETSIETIGIGLNRIRWNRNSNVQGTTFLVESSNEPAGIWLIIGTTTKTNYDTNYVDPRGRTYFRVRAQRGSLISEPGNIVVI